MRLPCLATLLTTTTLAVPTSAAMRILGESDHEQIEIAAMILTFDEQSPVGEKMFDTFQRLGATISLVEAPNNAEIRAAIRDFRGKTRAADVALVFVEGGLLLRGDTLFLAPNGVEIRRENDLLTRAVPLSSLVRGVGMAAIGGAVFALDHSVDAAPSVPRYTGQELRSYGTGTAVAVQEGFETALLAAINRYAGEEEIDLKDILEFADGMSGVTASELHMSVPLRRATEEEEDEAHELAETAAEEQLEEQAEEQVAEQADESVDEETTEPVEEEILAEPEIIYSVAELRQHQKDLDRDTLKSIQTGLRREGHYRGIVDGIMGRRTQRAIRAYQEALREDVTGYLTPAQIVELAG